MKETKRLNNCTALFSLDMSHLTNLISLEHLVSIMSWKKSEFDADPNDLPFGSPDDEPNRDDDIIVHDIIKPVYFNLKRTMIVIPLLLNRDILVQVKVLTTTTLTRKMTERSVSKKPQMIKPVMQTMSGQGFIDVLSGIGIHQYNGM